jgi:hypothetical protein
VADGFWTEEVNKLWHLDSARSASDFFFTAIASYRSEDQHWKIPFQCWSSAFPAFVKFIDKLLLIHFSLLLKKNLLVGDGSWDRNTKLKMRSLVRESHAAKLSL